MIEAHEQSFHHYDGAVDNDTEVYSSERKEVGAHTLQLQTHEGKQQRQWDNDRHDDGCTPVRHENENDYGHKHDTFDKVMCNCLRAIANEIVAIVKCFHLDIGGKNSVV